MTERPPICLVVPASIFLLDEKVWPSLGILKVAASLEARGYPVELVDLSGVANFEEAMTAHAALSSATIYGITATTPQMPATKKTIDAIRSARLGLETRIILGGPHPTLVCAAAKIERKKKHSDRAQKALQRLMEFVDVVVAGDGEDAIFQALNTTRGVIDADDPNGPLFLTPKRIEEAPLPARHLIDLQSYHYLIDEKLGTSIVGQLGCPMRCTFCTGRNSPMLRRMRLRSTDGVLREMEEVYRTYGYTAFFFLDDELNINKQMVELMDGIADLGERLGIGFKLRGFVKAELFTKEQAQAMHRAGFRWLLSGFESGNARILENIQKNATRDDNARMLDTAHEAGIKVKALMSIGHAGESAETVRDTEEWLIAHRPDDFDCTIIVPYPGSPYSDEATLADRAPAWTYVSPKTGDRLHMEDVDFVTTVDAYKGVPGEYVAHVFTDYLSREDLVRMRDALETSVRAKLQIPFYQSAAALHYEHSMGASGPLPPNILRKTGVSSSSNGGSP